MHPICAVGRTNFYSMVLILLSIIVAAIAVATSVIRYGISFAGFTRSGIARKDIVMASERTERSRPMKQFLVVVLPDGKIVTQRIADRL